MCQSPINHHGLVATTSAVTTSTMTTPVASSPFIHHRVFPSNANSTGGGGGGGGGGGFGASSGGGGGVAPNNTPLSAISPPLSMAQMSQPYTADVCQYGPIYNAYNYASPAVKMRTNPPYSRTAYPPSYHPHQNPFPNAAFYSRPVQNPYDYSPR